MSDRKKYNIDFNLAAKLNSSFSKNFKKVNGNIGKVSKELALSRCEARSSQKSMNKFSKSLDKTSYRARNAQKSMNGFNKSLSGIGAAIVGYVGLNEIKSFANSSVEAFKVQIDAETKLAAVMKNTKGVTLEQIDSIKKYAGELQNIGVIGDEVAISGTQQLATYQLQTSTLKTLMPGMEDLLAQQKGLNASAGDAVNIGNMLGKVMSGQTGALSRAGINFSKAQEKVLKFGTEQEKAAILAEVLEQNVGGVNKAMAETDPGKVQQITNAYGDMKEVIGKKLIPIQTRALTFLSKHVPKIQTALSNGIEYIDKKSVILAKRLSVFKPVISKLYSINKLIFSYIIERYNSFVVALEKSAPTINLIKDKVVVLLGSFERLTAALINKLKPVSKWMIETAIPMIITGIATIVSVGVGFIQFLETLYNNSYILQFIGDHLDVILLAIGGFVVAVKVIKAIQTAFVALKAAVLFGSGAMKAALLFLTSPIGLIAAAIAALIAIGYLVWKHWDTIVAFLKNLWAGFKVYLSTIWTALVTDFTNISNAIKAVFSAVGNFILSAFTTAYNGVIILFSGIGEFFRGMFEGIINFFKGGVNSWISIFNYVIEKINCVSFKVPDWVPKIGGNTVGFDIQQIPMLANGGIATGPTLAMIGEGSESEAVLPLSKLNGLLGLGKTKSNDTVHIVYNPILNFKTDTPVEEVQRILKRDKLELEKLIERILSDKKRLSMG